MKPLKHANWINNLLGSLQFSCPTQNIKPQRQLSSYPVSCILYLDLTAKQKIQPWATCESQWVSQQDQEVKSWWYWWELPILTIRPPKSFQKSSRRLLYPFHISSTYRSYLYRIAENNYTQSIKIRNFRAVT